MARRDDRGDDDEDDEDDELDEELPENLLFAVLEDDDGELYTVTRRDQPTKKLLREIGDFMVDAGVDSVADVVKGAVRQHRRARR